MLQSLPGSITTSTACDTKKDHFTQLADVVMPEKTHQTGDLRKVLQLKVEASIMVTSNIDVTDGLTNEARETVTNIITDQNQQNIQAIMAQFDNEAIGEDAKKESKYNTSTKMQFLLKKVRSHFLSKVQHHLMLPGDNFH